MFVLRPIFYLKISLMRRVRIELAECICALFAREDVPCEHVREIKDDPHLFDIWSTLPCDMMKLMHHVVGALMLIQILRARTHNMSSPQPNEVPSDAHHDFSSSHFLKERYTSP